MIKPVGEGVLRATLRVHSFGMKAGHPVDEVIIDRALLECRHPLGPREHRGNHGVGQDAGVVLFVPGRTSLVDR